MKRRQLVFVILIVLLFVLAFVLSSHLAANTGSAHSSPPHGNKISNYTIILNKYIPVSNGETYNYTVNVGGVNTIESVFLAAFSNYTPASLMLVQNGKVYNQISLNNVANAQSSYYTFADPPAVNLYGGIWYLIIQNIPSSGTIHVLVSVDYNST